VRANARHRGFSLLEVLVAAAVLSIGLLALAQLQGSLIRSTTEARAFSLATALAKDKIEELRAFDTLKTGAQSYQSLTDGSETLAPISGTTFQRSWTVTRYVFNRDPDGNPTTYDGRFEQYDVDTGDTPSPYHGNVASGYVEQNEFKRIAVNVVWNDPTGATQTVTIQDAIAAVAPNDSALIAEGGSAVIPRSLEVIIRDPTLTDGVPNGVIPLALSSDPTVDGTSTAATNPQPLLLGADYRVAETRFNVLTYGEVRNDGTAAAQSKIDTIVVACTCSTSLGTTNPTGWRPSFWNGYRYTVPEAASYGAPAGWTRADNESQNCTACCRDHHDPAGGLGPTGKGPRFDPRRTSHVHYSHDTSDQLVAGGTTYEESCRLIRVDGVYRVTADAFTDQVNLLETRNDGTSTPFVPTTQAAGNYQSFALRYLDARIVNNGNTATYNVAPGATAVASLEDPQPPSSPSRSINQPALVPISSGEQKWMHLRGLYVDYIEPQVIQSILVAKAECASDTATGGCAGSLAKKEAAVLRLVPFTSINLTEIGSWSPAHPAAAGGQDVLVYNNLLKCTVPAADGGPAAGCTTVVNGVTQNIDPARPVRGLVQKINASATAGNRPIVTATAYGSNSQLATATRTIDPDEGTALTDSQTFLIAGASGGGTNAASYKVAILGNYPLSSGAQPVIDTSPASSYVYSSTTVGGYAPPNPATVTPNPVMFGVPVTLLLRNYNYALTTYGQAASVVCTGPSGNKTLTPTSTNTNFLLNAQTTCKNYVVTGVTLNNVAVPGPFPIASTRTPGAPDGSLTEYTTLSLPAVNVNDVVGITMGSQADTLPAPTCTYVASDLTGAGNWKGSATPMVIPGPCVP
jgi:prepilin-type N-terminal cleavage/methylation domain-containing protein